MWLLVAICIFFIIYPYGIYPLILKLLPKYKGESQGHSQDKYLVTLFIAAYNEEKVIKEKLENSLKLRTDGHPLEIVVGSDGSTDATNAIVQAYAQKYPNIKLLNFCDRAGKVNVINRGLPQCKGEIVLLSDANAIYNEECLIHILPHFADRTVGCVAGEKRIQGKASMIAGNEGLYWKLEAKIKKMEAEVWTVIGADGACYAIRKELFQKLPQDTSVDDFLLSMKIVENGYRIVYEPGAYSLEEPGDTVQQELRRKTRIAAGNFYNLAFLGNFLRLDLASFMFISHKLLRWLSPFIFMVLTIVLMIQSMWTSWSFILLILLIISYGVAVLKYLNLGTTITDNRIGKICTYFYLTVWAQFLGFIKFMTGSQKAIWNTIRE
jgi:biofilm PGA synthesis N-glycosyltransferase PgaC